MGRHHQSTTSGAGGQHRPQRLHGGAHGRKLPGAESPPWGELTDAFGAFITMDPGSLVSGRTPASKLAQGSSDARLQGAEFGAGAGLHVREVTSASWRACPEEDDGTRSAVNSSDSFVGALEIVRTTLQADNKRTPAHKAQDPQLLAGCRILDPSASDPGPPTP